MPSTIAVPSNYSYNVDHLLIILCKKVKLLKIVVLSEHVRDKGLIIKRYINSSV